MFEEGGRLLKRRILVVEDDADSRMMVQMLLEREGYVVATAANGLEALASARQQRPDLIVLDLMMPLMDGRAFRAAQLADPDLASVPVVLTTAASPSDAALTVDASFQKPLDFDAFVGTLRTLFKVAA